MARYIVTDSSYFQPFSYDDLVKPLQQMTEAHNAAADAYDQLSLETEALRNYISENEDDKQAKAMYDNYINKLHTLQDNLWNRGYNTGTRRDLSAARAAYASDITRLKTSVQTRQERSKEYWDARHKNPDLVTGFDPGSSGLDNYLANSEYGRNWFSYSGTQFANEVATDLKARAMEMQRSYINNGLKVPGYLEYVIENGFSNDDINRGSALASLIISGAEVNANDYSNTDKLIASVLVNHLQQTGVRPGVGGNVSDEEFQRLFNYGLYGASQSIVAPERKLINDNVWHLNADFSKMAYNQRLKDDSDARKLAAAAALAEQNKPNREPVNRPVQSANAAKMEHKLAGIYDVKAYEGGKTVKLNMPDGSVRELHNPEEALQLFQSSPSNAFYNTTGLDVSIPASDWWKTKNSKQKGKYQNRNLIMENAGPVQMLKYGIAPGSVVVKSAVNGKYEYDAELTRRANEAKNGYDNQINTLARLNPGVDITGVGVTPEELNRLYKSENLPSGIAWYDVPVAIRSKYELGDRYGIPIVSTSAADNDLRQDYATAIEARYANAHGKHSWKTAEWGFYPVGEGNDSVGKENVAAKGLDKVFRLKSNGDIDPDSIKAIYVMPQDIKDGKVNIRLETSQGTFMTNIMNLGDDLDSALNDRLATALEIMLTPITNTIAVLDSNDDTGEGWDQILGSLLYGYEHPVIPGTNIPPSAQEVARNKDYQQQLLRGVNEFLEDAIAFGIDPRSLRPRQHKGYVSSKATGLVSDEIEE